MKPDKLLSETEDDEKDGKISAGRPYNSHQIRMKIA